MITRRDGILLIATAALAGLTMYQCGVSRNDPTILKAAQDSLDASKKDKALLQSDLLGERANRQRLEDQTEIWRNKAETYSAAGNRLARQADSLKRVLAAQPVPDTATTVPVALYRTAQQAMHLWENAFEEKDRAYTLLRDSVGRNDALVKQQLVALSDSVAEFLRREALRQPALDAGLKVGRCGWGPFGAFPCLTPKVAFVSGVVAGAVAGRYVIKRNLPTRTRS